MVSTILIVEDDTGVQKYLTELLIDNGYSVQVASDGIEALDKINRVVPDLVILDLGLPKLSGEGVVKEIRKEYPELRIIILSAKDTVQDIVYGLNLGADDYMTKPFVGEELLARVHARLKSESPQQRILKVGDLQLEARSASVKRGETQMQLTPQEFKLLEYLMMHEGQILTRDMILDRIWMQSSDIETRVVDVYMGYLRKKIDRGFPKKLLHSVRGFGYMIKAE